MIVRLWSPFRRGITGVHMVLQSFLVPYLIADALTQELYFRFEAETSCRKMMATRLRKLCARELPASVEKMVLKPPNLEAFIAAFGGHGSEVCGPEVFYASLPQCDLHIPRCVRRLQRPACLQ